MGRTLFCLWRDRRGQTAIEYSMIAAMIAILIVTAMGAIGLSVEKMFIPLEKAIGATKV